MKNTVLAIALAASAFALPAISRADDGDKRGVFINGNVGQSNLSKGAYDDNDTGYGANVGYRWAFSPSVRASVSKAATRISAAFVRRTVSAGLGRAKLDGWNLGVNGHFNCRRNWYVSARGGLFPR